MFSDWHEILFALRAKRFRVNDLIPLPVVMPFLRNGRTYRLSKPTGAIRHFIFAQNRLSLRSIMGHTTQLNGLFQKPPILLRHLSLTLYWADQQPQCVENYTCHHTCIQIQTFDPSTREGARSHTTVLCTFLQGKIYMVFCLSILKDSLLSNCHLCKAFFSRSVSALLK